MILFIMSKEVNMEELQKTSERVAISKITIKS